MPDAMRDRVLGSHTYTVPEISEMFCIVDNTLYNWIKEGKLIAHRDPYSKPKWTIDGDDFLKFIDTWNPQKRTTKWRLYPGEILIGKDSTDQKHDVKKEEAATIEIRKCEYDYDENAGWIEGKQEAGETRTHFGTPRSSGRYPWATSSRDSVDVRAKRSEAIIANLNEALNALMTIINEYPEFIPIIRTLL